MSNRAFKLEEATVRQICDAMEGGVTSCRAITEGYIKRIEAYDGKGPSLKAIITVNPEALKEADRLDRIFREKGPIGPLHGIPILLKDNVETADMVTTCGSLSLKNYRPEEDAFITKRLKAAGALILAKANMHEFAIWGESVSSILGQVVNPYDLTRTAGGSSGGTGAGIAANFATLGIGTDTINSIRSPSSACACVGIRPTLGLVGRGGIFPYSLNQDAAGPICRTVEDGALVLDAIAGYDPGDPETAWSADQGAGGYTKYLCEDGLRGKRIGVLRSLFGTEPAHEDVNAVMEGCLQAMRDGGAGLVEAPEPIDTDYLVAKVSVHLHTLREDLEGYLKALGPKVKYHGLEALIASGEIHPGIVDSMKTALTLSRDGEEYRSRVLLRLALRTRIMKIMADLKLDALVYPHQKRLCAPLGKTQTERNGVLGSVTGFPAITLPGGFSKPTASAPDGVPVGIEFLGRPWSEGTLLSIASSFEGRTRFRKPPYSTPAIP